MTKSKEKMCICSREIEKSDGENIKIKVFLPEFLTDSDGEMSCMYEISGLNSKAIKKYAHGVDGFQAIIHAMKSISTYLYTSEEYKNSELSWCGDKKDLGLPVTKSISDLGMQDWVVNS